jgi:hypothetical protein
MYLPALALAALCLLSGLLWPVGVGGIVGDAASAVRAREGAPPAATVYVERMHGGVPR